MQRSLTGYFKAFIFGVIVFLVLISMAIWGVSDAFTPSSRDAAAMIGKDKVRLVDFDREFRNRLRDENRQRPERITTKQAYGEGLHRTVVNQMITRTLLNLDADDLGIDINSRDALAFVESLGTFNNAITGKYDKARLVEVLSRQNTGITVKQFEKDVYSQLRIDQTISGILAGVIAPPEFGDQQYKFMTEQRKVRLLTLDREAVVLPPDPSDDELQAYIDENPTPYTAPEYRRFTLLRLELVDVMPDLEASEEEIADLFDLKIKTGQLGSPETRSLLQFISADEASANAVTEALNSGADPAQIQIDLNLDDPIVYTDILVTGSTDEEVGKVGFTLKEGEAKTVKGELGSWNSVLTTGITAGDVPVLENEREAIEEELNKNKAEVAIYDAQDAIQLALEEGATLEEAAKANKVSIASYDFISRLGENQSGAPMEGLNQFVGVAGDDKILTEIFTSEPEYDGDIIETATKGIAAVRVDEVKDSVLREFAEIKEQALTNWRLEKADEALGVLSDELNARISDGESLEAIAAEFDNGVSLREVVLMRAARVDGVSGPLAVRIFDARQGQSVRGRAANGLDRVIAKIDSIVPNSDTLAGGIADSFKSQVENLINDDIQQAYRKALLVDYPARTVDENIDRVLGISAQ